MPRARRRFRIDRTTAFIVLTALVLGALYMVAATWVESRFAGTVPSASTLSKSAVGLSAWHDYLARLGLRPQLLTQFDSLPETGTIVVGAPFEQTFTDGDVKSLRDWVSAGGRLIFVGNESMLIVADNFDGDAASGSSAVASSVAPVFPAAIAEGVRAIATGETGGSDLNNAVWVPVFADKAGTEVAQRRLGLGEVLWVIDGMPVSNAGIDRYDDAAFAVRLAVAAPGPVYFDEYHHGLTSKTSVWTRLGDAGRTAILLLLAGALVLLFARGRRIGPAIARTERPAARGSAYIAQLAVLYRTAGARADALRVREDALGRALLRRYGGRAAGLERSARARTALETSSALRQRGTIDRTEFVTAAALLRDARNEVEGGNG
jgi:hypothetical protein